MGLFERIEARRNNGETIADHTEGPTMEPQSEESDPTPDAGLPPLDLRSDGAEHELIGTSTDADPIEASFAALCEAERRHCELVRLANEGQRDLAQHEQAAARERAALEAAETADALEGTEESEKRLELARIAAQSADGRLDRQHRRVAALRAEADRLVPEIERLRRACHQLAAPRVAEVGAYDENAAIRDALSHLVPALQDALAATKAALSISGAVGGPGYWDRVKALEDALRLAGGAPTEPPDELARVVEIAAYTAANPEGLERFVRDPALKAGFDRHCAVTAERARIEDLRGNVERTRALARAGLISKDDVERAIEAARAEGIDV